MRFSRRIICLFAAFWFLFLTLSSPFVVAKADTVTPPGGAATFVTLPVEYWGGYYSAPNICFGTSNTSVVPTGVNSSQSYIGLYSRDSLWPSLSGWNTFIANSSEHPRTLNSFLYVPFGSSTYPSSSTSIPSPRTPVIAVIDLVATDTGKNAMLLNFAGGTSIATNANNYSWTPNGSTGYRSGAYVLPTDPDYTYFIDSQSVFSLYVNGSYVTSATAPHGGWSLTNYTYTASESIKSVRILIATSLSSFFFSKYTGSGDSYTSRYIYAAQTFYVDPNSYISLADSVADFGDVDEAKSTVGFAPGIPSTTGPGGDVGSITPGGSGGTTVPGPGGSSSSFDDTEILNSLDSVQSTLESQSSLVEKQTEAIKEQTDAINQQTEEQKGFFARIIQFAQKVESFIQSIVDFFSDFPNNLIDILIHLILPTREQIQSLIDEMGSALETKLGIFGTAVNSFLQLFSYLADASPYDSEAAFTLTFPGIPVDFSEASVPSDSPIGSLPSKYWLVEPTVVNLSDYEKYVSVIRPALDAILIFIVAFANFNTLKKFYDLITNNNADSTDLAVRE